VLSSRLGQDQTMLTNGSRAPQFALTAQDGKIHSLADYAGRPLVLFFFRGRFCPTSKRYLIQWQEFDRKVHNLGARLLAISYDTIENHAWMAERYDIRFPLLSDSNLEVSRSYGVYIDRHEDGFDHGEPGFIIIDKDGKIAYSLLASGPKGFPSPGELSAILIYMFVHEGKY